METSALSPDLPLPSGARTAAATTAAAWQAPRPAAAGRRLAWLDAAKGIGIILVVCGHALGGLFDAKLIAFGSGLWLGFYLIYVFHMPMFFLLSASLVFSRVSTRPGRFWSSLLTRILWPYLLWGAVQTAVMIGASGLINHPLGNGVADDFIRMLWQPPGVFWFLYALLFLHAAAGLCLHFGGKLLFAQVVATVYLLCMLPADIRHFVTTHLSMTCLLFYTLGICFGDELIALRDRPRRPAALLLLCGAVWFASVWVVWTGHLDYASAAALPAAFAGTAGVIILSRALPSGLGTQLARLGRLSMPIYVLHVLFVAGTRIALMHGLGWHDPLAMLPLMIGAGLLGPLAIHALARRARLDFALGLG